MKRYRSNIPAARLTFRDAAADRFLYSYEFVGRALDPRAKYQGTALKQVAERTVTHLQEAKTLKEAAMAVAAAEGGPRTAVTALERERARNPYVTLVESGGLDIGTLTEDLPDIDPIISTLTSVSRTGTVGEASEGRLLEGIEALAQWSGVAAISSALMGEATLEVGGVGVSGVSVHGASPVAADSQVPVITAIVPSSVAPGGVIQVVGGGFGNANPQSQLLIGTSPALNVAWQPTKITGIVPALPAGTHPIVVLRADGASATARITVATTPTASTGTPPSGQAGAPSHVDVQVLLGLLKSPIGYLFADRLRIRPNGFGIGEHIHTISLAPGEEVVLEQKTWTKRDISLEELLEDEREVNIELATAYSTELSEALTREREVRAKAGVSNTFTTGAKATVPIYGVPVEFSASNSLTFSSDIEAADKLTRNETSKRSFQRSSKVASKARSMHKTTFKVTTETGYESSSKRTIRNANRDAALDVHLFKVMSVLDVEQQRYGVRLGWAPFVKDPGFAARERARLAAEILAREAEAALDLPPKPQQPAIPPAQSHRMPGPAVDLNKYFGFWNDMRVDVTAEIDLGTRRWDGNPVEVILSFSGKRAAGAYVVGSPWMEGTVLKATVHVGIDWTLTEARGSAQVQIAAIAYEISSTDHEAALTQYHKDVGAWEKEIEKRKREARSAAGLESEAERDIYFDVDPVAELLAAVVRSHFAAGVRDDFYEVELWHQVFEFEQAGYSLYPGTWIPGDLPVPDRGPSEFVNASWARVYLPIRPGYELFALRFIYGGVIGQALDQAHEAGFDKILKELAAFRTERYGSAEELLIDEDTADVQETVDVLARWMESIPTDGTHAEMTLSETTGLSEVAEAAQDDEAKLRGFAIEERSQDVELKEKAVDLLEAPTATVAISTDDRP